MRQIIGRQVHKLMCRKNKGSAMIVAIIVSMVVFAFALSLLLAAYSLFMSSVRKITQSQCRELAKSVSMELEEEIAGVSYASFEEQKQALDEGKDGLWQYLRYNVCQGSWPYYVGDDVNGHDGSSAYRYFSLSASGGDSDSYAAMADDISVCIYWEDDGGYVSSKDDVELVVRVVCSKGTQTAAMETRYVLSCMTYDDTDDVTDNGNPAVNPSDNLTEASEQWIWSYLERD